MSLPSPTWRLRVPRSAPPGPSPPAQRPPGRVPARPREPLPPELPGGTLRDPPRSARPGPPFGLRCGFSRPGTAPGGGGADPWPARGQAAALGSGGPAAGAMAAEGDVFVRARGRTLTAFREGTGRGAAPGGTSAQGCAPRRAPCAAAQPGGGPGAALSAGDGETDGAGKGPGPAQGSQLG